MDKLEERIKKTERLIYAINTVMWISFATASICFLALLTLNGS
jgi:hypothetical protein